MIVKNLRASQNALQAEVNIGQKDNGSYVTVNVKLDRRHKDVMAAFVLLDNVLLREAQAAVDNAITNERRRRQDGAPTQARTA